MQVACLNLKSWTISYMCHSVPSFVMSGRSRRNFVSVFYGCTIGQHSMQAWQAFIFSPAFFARVSARVRSSARLSLSRPCPDPRWWRPRPRPPRLVVACAEFETQALSRRWQRLLINALSAGVPGDLHSIHLTTPFPPSPMRGRKQTKTRLFFSP